MKKGKLLCLLAAMLSFALLFSACAGTAPALDGASTSGSGQETTDTAPEKTQKETDRQEVSQDPIHQYFDLIDEEDKIAYTKVERMDGELLEYDREHHLASLLTKELDTENKVIETVKVYDLKTGEVINEQSVSNLLYAPEVERVELEVDLDYPIIRVSKESWDKDAARSVYDVSYYLAKKDAEVLRQTNKGNYSLKRFDNDLVAVDMGDDVLWIDRNMEIVRTVESIAANGYFVEEFNAEYQGYLYAWNQQELQVFNRAGMCCATYTIDHEGALSPHVLDDGDVLIQDLEFVDAFTECDFVLHGYRCVLKSYVMSFLDGTVKEVTLDYVVDSLDTAYGDEADMPFELAEGKENQALIYRFANGQLSHFAEYVVMNNELTIEYTLKNETVGVYLQEAYATSNNFYVAPVKTGGFYQDYMFSFDGKPIAVYGNGWINEKFIVAEDAIYDYSMKKVFDIAESEFAGGELWIDSKSDNVFLSKVNFVTCKTEWYLFNGEEDEPVLLTDGVESTLLWSDDGYYVTRDACRSPAFSGNEYTVYSSDGEVLLITTCLNPDFYLLDGMLLVKAEFEGNPIVYVVK